MSAEQVLRNPAQPRTDRIEIVDGGAQAATAEPGFTESVHREFFGHLPICPPRSQQPDQRAAKVRNPSVEVGGKGRFRGHARGSVGDTAKPSTEMRFLATRHAAPPIG